MSSRLLCYFYGYLFNLCLQRTECDFVSYAVVVETDEDDIDVGEGVNGNTAADGNEGADVAAADDTEDTAKEGYGYKPPTKKVYVPVYVPEHEKKKSTFCIVNQ